MAPSYKEANRQADRSMDITIDRLRRPKYNLSENIKLHIKQID